MHKTVLSNFTTKRFIKLVQQSPALWDKTHPNYRDKSIKNQHWNNICAALDPNYDSMDESLKQELCHALIKRWYNIRDAFAKNLKLRADPIKRPKNPYLYAKSLAFLESCYTYEKNTRNIIPFGKSDNDPKLDDNDDEDDDNDGDNEFETEEDTANWGSNIFVDINEASCSEPVAKKIKKETAEESLPAASNDEIISLLARLIQKEEDQDRAFFKSLIPAVKALSEESKLEFRIQVMSSLKMLRKKDESFKKGKRSEEEDSD